MPKYGMMPEQGLKLVSAFTMLHMWRHMHLRWSLRLLHMWRHLCRHLIRLHLLWHAWTRTRLHRLLGHRLWHCPTCLHFKKMIKIGIWTRNLSMLFLDLWTRHPQKLILAKKNYTHNDSEFHIFGPETKQYQFHLYAEQDRVFKCSIIPIVVFAAH